MGALASGDVGAEEDLRHFVRVSPRDGRYFELDNGKPYIPIGLNLCFVRPPRTDESLAVMDKWFNALAAQGGNYTRVWLSYSPFFDVEHARSGQYDEESVRRIGQLLACARKHGIRLKLSVDHFRNLGETQTGLFAKPIHLDKNGGPARSTADFFNNPALRQRYKAKYHFFAKHLGNDPIIFGWELWNEMNCIDGDWRGWTVEMLAEMRRCFPKNLCMQSLGSFDDVRYRDMYGALCRMEGNDVLQVHRYLDCGARWDICCGPVDLFAANAVRELQAFSVRKPVLLAESGAVEPRHSGPFKLYGKDRDGLLLHDILFAPFFAGAAGPGHVWHWDGYVEANDLWWHFGRFAEAVAGIDPPAEAFQPQQVEHPRLRVLALRGVRTTLAWLRDPQMTWQSVLVEGRTAKVLDGLSVVLPAPAAAGKVAAEAYDPWSGARTPLAVEQGKVPLPPFTRSLIVRLTAD